jgi:hypothetical protein
MIPYCTRILSIRIVVILILARSSVVRGPPVKRRPIVLSVDVNRHVRRSIIRESHNSLFLELESALTRDS